MLMDIGVVNSTKNVVAENDTPWIFHDVIFYLKLDWFTTLIIIVSTV